MGNKKIFEDNTKDEVFRWESVNYSVFAFFFNDLSLLKVLFFFEKRRMKSFMVQFRVLLVEIWEYEMNRVRVTTV